MVWADGTAIPDEMRDMLLKGLDPGFEIERAQFKWDADGSLSMALRLAVTRPGAPREIWNLELGYPADEATALRDRATSAEREWFTMMVRTHLSEWWATRTPVVVTDARRVK
jgi:hypothetical protein